MEQKKLFLLDAYALIYRAYYALIRSPRFTASGFNTSAIFGFCNTLDELLRKENPEYIAVCFDPHGPTFRHEAYKEYKANREKQPEDITLALPYIRDIIHSKGIISIEVPGYEADDVIGTLSRKAENMGFITYMMTPDKDYGQLVTPNVFVYKPSLKGQDFEIRGVSQILERYGISTPLQLIDMLALEGDSVDNIPGCPGIGPKTAQKLISQYGSVEKLIESVTELKGSIKDKIENNAEQIIFSKFLATIKTDVPLDVDIESLKKNNENINDLRRIYEKLEFRSLLNRLPSSMDNIKGNNQTDRAKQIYSTPTLFNLLPEEEGPSAEPLTYDDLSIDITNPTYSDLDKLSEKLNDYDKLSFVLKSVGENAMNAQSIALSLSTDNNTAYYILFPADFDIEARKQLNNFLKSLFSRRNLTIITYDFKRTLVLLRDYNLAYNCNIFDVQLANYIIDPESRSYIPEMAHNILSYNSIEYSIESRNRKPYDKTEPTLLSTVLPEMAYITYRLYSPLISQLQAVGLMDYYNKVEMPLSFVLADMEITGVRIDSSELKKLSHTYSERLKNVEKEIYELAGVDFNIGSPSQVGEILFQRLAIDTKAKRTKKGTFSTTEEILEKYRVTHPIVGLILQYRQLKKLLTTYVDALPRMVDSRTGRIHTTYNQTVTTTGRLSSTNPNLQNIPVRGEDGREIRRAFVSDEDCVLMAADYSQIELRLMADFSNDPNMVDAFHKNLDIHQDTASRIYHIPLEDVTSDQRRNAKTANFGIIYGISPFGLSERLGISRAEAKQLINDYMTTYPSIKDYIDRIIQQAKEQGYVTTFTGRRRYLREINSQNAIVRGYGERNAVNAPLQGSAADIIKKAMVNISNILTSMNMKSRMIMQVHDELIFNVPQSEILQMHDIVTREMEDAYDGNVKMTVSIGTGKNWLEAH